MVLLNTRTTSVENKNGATTLSFESPAGRRALPLAFLIATGRWSQYDVSPSTTTALETKSMALSSERTPRDQCSWRLGSRRLQKAAPAFPTSLTMIYRLFTAIIEERIFFSDYETARFHTAFSTISNSAVSASPKRSSRQRFQVKIGQMSDWTYVAAPSSAAKPAGIMKLVSSGLNGPHPWCFHSSPRGGETRPNSRHAHSRESARTLCLKGCPSTFTPHSQKALLPMGRRQAKPADC